MRYQFRRYIRAVSNKIKYNLRNVHIAPINESGSGKTYATPITFPGAKAISLDAQGEISKFYADGVTYWQAASNNGYEGDLEMALFTDEIRKAILSEIEDANKVLFEEASAKSIPFALLFEIEGDAKATRFCFYNCTMTRPSTASETIEESIEPGTESATISCAPDDEGIIRAKTTAETNAEAYDGWFSNVYKKAAPTN